MDIAAAEDRYAALEHSLSDIGVALAHGKMKAADRDIAMQAFRDGDAQLLVATTVVEVGVDVPEASVIIIEHAERFGLAQLHQLRGRVGRSTQQSSCLLIYQGPLSDTASRRLAVMRDTNDGFVIAEEDLELRGPGNFWDSGNLACQNLCLPILPRTAICLGLPELNLAVCWTEMTHQI